MSRDHYRNSGSSFRKVFVGNLGDRATQLELEGAFSCFGPLRSVWIARNPPGFAFVEFEDPDNALEAVRALDGSILCGCPVKVELAHTNSRTSDRTPPSPGRCYACGERGHYARDCSADNAGPENELDHSFAHTAEGFGNISELCLDPETYEGCDWNSVIELMGIQPRTHNQRNRHDGSSFSGYQDPSNEHSRNTAQLQNRSDRSWQGDWYDSPSQRVWLDSPLQQNRSYTPPQQNRSYTPPQQNRSYTPPQQNRSYTPQQSNWDGSLPQRNMSNRAQQQNWSGRLPQQSQGDIPSQRVWIDSPLQRRNDRPLQQSRSTRRAQRYLDDTPPQRYLDDTPPQQYLDDRPAQQYPYYIPPQRYPDYIPPQRYPDYIPPQRYLDGILPQQYLGDTLPQQYIGDTPAQQYLNDTPAHRYPDDTPAHRYPGDTPAHQYLDHTPRQWKDDRPPQQNRSDRSQPQHTSGGTASHSSVSKSLNDTSEDIKCAICLDTEGDLEMEYLPCGHGFHAKCCNDWLSINGLCPVCRTSVASQSGNVQDNPERNVHNRPTVFVGSIWLA